MIVTRQTAAGCGVIGDYADNYKKPPQHGKQDNVQNKFGGSTIITVNSFDYNNSFAVELHVHNKNRACHCRFLQGLFLFICRIYLEA